MEDWEKRLEQSTLAKLRAFKEISLEALKIAERTGRRVDIKVCDDCTEAMEIIFYESGEEAE